MASEDDRIVLAVFVATQIKRVPTSREHVMALDAALRKVLGGRDFDPAVLEGYPEMTRDDAKAFSLLSLVDPDPYAEHILDKTWLLFETDAATPFYVSDNPVAMQNLERSGPAGNLGLAVPGIEIYLPISGTLTLGFFAVCMNR